MERLILASHLQYPMLFESEAAPRRELTDDVRNQHLAATRVSGDPSCGEDNRAMDFVTFNDRFTRGDADADAQFDR